MRKIISKSKGLNLNYAIAISLFLALFINIVSNSLIYAKIDQIITTRIADQKERERPADLEIVYIYDATCTDCYDILPFIEAIKKSNVNITKETEFQRDSAEAADLIQQYEIKKLPTFIVRGEITKDASLSELWTKLGEIKDEDFVFNKTLNPYVSAETGEIRGKVSLTVISDANCKDCFDAILYENLPKQLGMSVAETNRIEYRTNAGRNLVQKHNIKAIPTIIIEGDLESYATETLEKYGIIDGNIFVLTDVALPYLSTVSGVLKGGINLTILTDNSCEECYDVAVYDDIIKQFGLYIKTNKQIDVLSYSGKSLVNKYKIETVPTIVMTGDVDLYNKPGSVWAGIGTTEFDGAYVVREQGLKQLGIYKNLVTKEVIGKDSSGQ